MMRMAAPAPPARSTPGFSQSVDEPVQPRSDRISDAVRSKMHPEIQALSARLARTGGYLPPMHEMGWVRDGSLYLRITLADRSPATLEKLRQAGFLIAGPKAGLVLTGRIAIEKLAALAALDAVRHIAPVTAIE